MSRADSFDFESLKPARHLARSFTLEAKLSQPNPHTHSLEREREHLEKKWKLVLFILLSLMITNEHPWPLFICKSLYKNSLELEAFKISRTSPIFIPKYLILKFSRNLL